MFFVDEVQESRYEESRRSANITIMIDTHVQLLKTPRLISVLITHKTNPVMSECIIYKSTTKKNITKKNTSYRVVLTEKKQ